MFDPRLSDTTSPSMIEVLAGPQTVEFIRLLKGVKEANPQEAFSRACRRNLHDQVMPDGGPYLLTDGQFTYREELRGDGKTVTTIRCPAFNQMGSPDKGDTYFVPEDSQVLGGAAPKKVLTFQWSL